MTPTNKAGSCCVLVVMAAGCGSQSTPDAAERLRPIRAEPAERAPVRDAAWFPGRVEARSAPSVSFRVPGRVEDVRVDVGQVVERGQVLAELDPRDFRSRVARAAANVARVKAEAQRTARIAGRNERLFESNAVSREERDQARDLAEASVAALSAAEQELELAERELAYTRSTAPEDGTVLSRDVDPGDNVAAGQPILRMGGITLEVRVEVPETKLARFEAGAPVEVLISAVDDTPVMATVSRVAKSSAKRGALYPVLVELSEELPGASSGMSARVKLTEAGGTVLTTVPPTALASDEQGPFVWIAEATGEESGGFEVYTIRRRTIELERLAGRDAFLSTGVQADELVVSAGANYLSEGQRVRLAQKPPLVRDDFVSPPRLQLSGASVSDGDR